MQFLKNPPSESELSQHYDNHQGLIMQSSPSWPSRFLRRISLGRDLNSVLPMLKGSDLIVDFGAGDGSLSQELKSRGHRVFAVDQFPAGQWKNTAIPYRQLNLNGDSFVAADLIQEGSAPRLVIMRHVFEHLLNPSAVLRELSALGVQFVLVIVPNVQSPWAKRLGSSWFYWDPPRHTLFFSPASLSRIASLNGYRVTEQKCYGIDELVVSFYRRALLRPPHLLLGRDGSLGRVLINLCNPKGIISSLSSVVSFAGTTVCWSLMERNTGHTTN